MTSPRDRPGRAPLSRRALLARLLVAGSAAALAPATLRAMARDLADGDGHGHHAPRPIGLQLYTVRKLMQQDVAATLAAVAAIGYREVEPAGLFDLSPGDWRALLDRHGLSAPSAHVALPESDEAWRATVRTARAIGHTWLVIPWVSPAEHRTRDAWLRLADRLTALGRLSAAEGVRIAYHNHDFEFAAVPGGPTGFDLLADQVDPAYVDLELDLFWMQRAARDPWPVLRTYRNIRMFHCKDIGPGPGYAMLDVGDGTLDWARIVKAARDHGVRHLYVEHDNPTDPLVSARRSHAALSKAMR